jgi:hypothetical protein
VNSYIMLHMTMSIVTMTGSSTWLTDVKTSYPAKYRKC